MTSSPRAARCATRCGPTKPPAPGHGRPHADSPPGPAGRAGRAPGRTVAARGVCCGAPLMPLPPSRRVGGEMLVHRRRPREVLRPPGPVGAEPVPERRCRSAPWSGPRRGRPDPAGGRGRRRRRRPPPSPSRWWSRARRRTRAPRARAARTPLRATGRRPPRPAGRTRAAPRRPSSPTRAIRVVTPLRAAASRTATAPQPSRPASTRRRSGWSARDAGERVDERRARPCGARASPRTRRTADGCRAPRAGGGRRASVGVNRSWSTPCGATTTGAVGASTAASRSRVWPLTAITAPARRVLDRIIRRKNATFERSCHSGCSKNVRSCTVTTLGIPSRSGSV